MPSRRATSQSPVRGSGRQHRRTEDVATLADILKNDDVDALSEFAEENPDLLTSKLKFPSHAKRSVALAVAVEHGSWDVAKELVFTIWPGSNIDIDDLELEWRDAGCSLKSLLKTNGMPRPLKKRLAKAVDEADKLDGDSGGAPAVSTQPGTATPGVPAGVSSKGLPKQYQTGLGSHCGISSSICYHWTLGEVYGQLDGVNMGKDAGCCVVFSLPFLFGGVIGAIFPVVVQTPALATVLNVAGTILPHCYVRTKVNAQLGIEEDTLKTMAISYCCICCSAEQMKVEMWSRAKAK